MNVYDCANELAKAMRESQNTKIKEAKAALEQDPKAKRWLGIFKIEPGNRISEISGTGSSGEK
ncbi:MAG: YlbF family regulator [Phascolarctobacterium faecium]